MSNTLTSKVSGRMSSRGWAIALGIGAIVLAAILLVVYLDRYRSRVSSENAPTPVLMAKQLIPQGTPGTTIAQQGMYEPTTLPRKSPAPRRARWLQMQIRPPILSRAPTTPRTQ